MLSAKCSLIMLSAYKFILMLHVFFIHSGITIISSFDFVKKLLQKEEEVVIVTSRGVKWSFFLDSLQVVNLDELLKGKGEDINLRKSTIKTICKQIKDWKLYERSLKEIINNTIVKGREYYMYFPIYLDEFVRHPKCEGYYFLEEGVFAYYDRDYVTRIARNTFQTHFKKLIFPLFGERYRSIDYEGGKFIGSIAISEQAFPWHKKEHIVSDISSYINDVGNNALPFNNIIATDVLFDDLPTIKKCLRELLSFIQKEHPGSVAIKLHPMMYTKYHEKAIEIENIVGQLDSSVKILPKEYIVENIIFKFHTNIFSVIGLSSLSLYAICFDAKTYFIHKKNDSFVIDRIDTIPDFLTAIRCQ